MLFAIIICQLTQHQTPVIQIHTLYLFSIFFPLFQLTILGSEGWHKNLFVKLISLFSIWLGSPDPRYYVGGLGGVKITAHSPQYFSWIPFSSRKIQIIFKTATLRMVMGRGEGNRREKWREEGKSNRRVIITFCPCLFPFEGNYSLKEKSFSDGGVNEWEGLSFITICAYSWSFVTIHGYSWFLKIPNSCWLFVIICGTKLCQSLPLAKSNILYASYLCFDRNFLL